MKAMVYGKGNGVNGLHTSRDSAKVFLPLTTKVLWYEGAHMGYRLQNYRSYEHCGVDNIMICQI